MKRALVLMTLLLLAGVAWGQDAQPLPVHVLSAAELDFKPSAKALLGPLAGSGLKSTSTNVLLAYDQSGKVVGVKLDRTTGSKSLDSAILRWAANVRVRTQQAGIGSLPISFELQ